MSAAVKLKALSDLTLKNLDGVVISRITAGEQLAAALPQIVALVQAAEADASLHQFPADLASCPNPLCVALAALDEALS